MRTYTLALSVVLHILVLTALIVSPIVATDALPDLRRAVSFVTVKPPTPAGPPPQSRSSSRPRATHVGRADVAPVESVAGIRPEPAIEPSEFGDPNGVPGGDPNGIRDSMLMDPDPPPPPAPEPPKPTEPIHVGGAIREPRKIQHVAPVYPRIAQDAGVQGLVILEAEIGEDGRVRNVRVLRSVRLLDEAAASAVRQWLFTPTLLNGVPVPVVMTVTVAFTLQR